MTAKEWMSWLVYGVRIFWGRGFGAPKLDQTKVTRRDQGEPEVSQSAKEIRSDQGKIG